MSPSGQRLSAVRTETSLRVNLNMPNHNPCQAVSLPGSASHADAIALTEDPRHGQGQGLEQLDINVEPAGSDKTCPLSPNSMSQACTGPVDLEVLPP